MTMTRTTRWALAALACLIISGWLLVDPAVGEPTFTVYDEANCTITVTGSGRTDFEVTRGDVVELYHLEKHVSTGPLDVNGVAWSVAVARTGQGFVVVASGEAVSCDSQTTTTIPQACDDVCQPPTTTTIPEVTTTTQPDVTTTTEGPDTPPCEDGSHDAGAGVCLPDEEGG